MSFAALLTRIAAGVEAGDGAAVAACFTEDGVYHDVFYGSFRGRAAIAEMIETCFHRDGEAFRWRMIDPVESGDRGYARYIFSYRSRAPQSEGVRAMFEGVVIARLRDGLIEDYDEIAEASVGLSMLGMEDARLAKFIAKRAEMLRSRGEAAQHLE
ncbi:MAG: nuclear transport factor 2 family protein [Pseudomonadota bacterium]